MGISITKENYVYVKNENGVYLFNHIIDPLNVSNLLRGFKEITFPHQHVNNWFDKKMMKNIIENFFQMLINSCFQKILEMMKKCKKHGCSTIIGKSGCWFVKQNVL